MGKNIFRFLCCHNFLLWCEWWALGDGCRAWSPSSSQQRPRHKLETVTSAAAGWASRALLRRAAAGNIVNLNIEYSQRRHSHQRHLHSRVSRGPLGAATAFHSYPNLTDNGQNTVMKGHNKAIIRQTSDSVQQAFNRNRRSYAHVHLHQPPTHTAPHMDTGSLSSVDSCQLSIYFFFAFKWAKIWWLVMALSPDTTTDPCATSFKTKCTSTVSPC